MRRRLTSSAGVEEPEDPLRGGHRRLQHVELLGEVGDRPPEALRVLDEGHERAQGRARRASTCGAAVDQDERDGERGQELDRGVEDRVVEDRAHVGVGVLAVDRGEGGAVALLAPEQLHHRHAGEVLLQEGVDARHPLAGLAEATAARPCGTSSVTRKKSGITEKVTRASRQSRASITPMIPNEGEEVAEDRDHPRGEQLVHRVHVGGDPGHEPPHRVACRSRPTCSRCRCAKISRRMSCMIRCPVICMM